MTDTKKSWQPTKKRQKNENQSALESWDLSEWCKSWKSLWVTFRSYGVASSEENKCHIDLVITHFQEEVHEVFRHPDQTSPQVAWAWNK